MLRPLSPDLLESLVRQMLGDDQALRAVDSAQRAAYHDTVCGSSPIRTEGPGRASNALRGKERGARRRTLVDMSKARLEAFSDGVLAVAITLLVLNLRVPSTNPTMGHRPSLGHQLLLMWPQYAAYVTSFMTIGIIWINHHAMISRLREVDHVILILNLLLLMSIALLPFATDLMAQYLKGSRGQQLAAAVYSGAFLLMSICFTALNRHILFQKVFLLHDPPSEQWRRTAYRRATLGLIPYAIATLLAVVSPSVTLAICGALAVFYALPFASSTGTEA